MRFACASLLALAGCGGSPSGPTRLVDDAVLAGVSPDEKYVASYTGYSTLAGGGPTGTLSVLTVSGGATTRLADGAFDASFNRGGSTLLYATGPAPSIDSGSTAVYGKLGMWTPGMTGGAAITAGYAIRTAQPPDNAWVLVLDGAKPTTAQDGDLLLAKASACSGASCPSKILASGRVGAMAASLDGKWGAYVIRNGTGVGATWQTFLVDVGAGTAAKVAETTGAGGSQVAFSPDGALLATTTANGIIPLQLQVIATATGMPVPWAAQPAMTGTAQAIFTDGQTLWLHALTLQGDGGLYRTTAAAATQIAGAGGTLEDQKIPAAAGRFLFVATNPANGVEAMEMFDAQAATPAPIMLAGKTNNFPTVADDATMARILDDFDAGSRLGTLVAIALPSGTTTRVAPGVAATAAGFAEGTSKLLYISASDPAGAGALDEWQAGGATALVKGAYNWRSRNGNLYFAITAPDPSATPPLSAAIYVEPLP